MKKRKNLHRKGEQHVRFPVTNYNYHGSSESFHHFLEVILFLWRLRIKLLVGNTCFLRIGVDVIVQTVRARLFE
jgi:hypothetical protein